MNKYSYFARVMICYTKYLKVKPSKKEGMVELVFAVKVARKIITAGWTVPASFKVDKFIGIGILKNVEFALCIFTDKRGNDRLFVKILNIDLNNSKRVDPTFYVNNKAKRYNLNNNNVDTVYTHIKEKERIENERKY